MSSCPPAGSNDSLHVHPCPCLIGTSAIWPEDRDRLVASVSACSQCWHGTRSHCWPPPSLAQRGHLLVVMSTGQGAPWGSEGPYIRGVLTEASQAQAQPLDEQGRRRGPIDLARHEQVGHEHRQQPRIVAHHLQNRHCCHDTSELGLSWLLSQAQAQRGVWPPSRWG